LGQKQTFSQCNRHVRFASECVAKLFAAMQSRNNRIRLNDALNQCCTHAFVLESLLLILAAKIVLQHIPSKSRQFGSVSSLSAKGQKQTSARLFNHLTCRGEQLVVQPRQLAQSMNSLYRR
jgi:hypothetical protein